MSNLIDEYNGKFWAPQIFSALHTLSMCQYWVSNMCLFMFVVRKCIKPIVNNNYLS